MDKNVTVVNNNSANWNFDPSNITTIAWSGPQADYVYKLDNEVNNYCPVYSVVIFGSEEPIFLVRIPDNDDHTFSGLDIDGNSIYWDSKNNVSLDKFKTLFQTIFKCKSFVEAVSKLEAVHIDGKSCLEEI